VSVHQNDSKSSADDFKNLFTFSYNYEAASQNPFELTSNGEVAERKNKGKGQNPPEEHLRL